MGAAGRLPHESSRLEKNATDQIYRHWSDAELSGGRCSHRMDWQGTVQSALPFFSCLFGDTYPLRFGLLELLRLLLDFFAAMRAYARLVGFGLQFCGKA